MTTENGSVIWFK